MLSFRVSNKYFSPLKRDLLNYFFFQIKLLVKSRFSGEKYFLEQNSFGMRQIHMCNYKHITHCSLQFFPFHSKELKFSTLFFLNRETSSKLRTFLSHLLQFFFDLNFFSAISLGFSIGCDLLWHKTRLEIRRTRGGNSTENGS